MLGSSLRSVCRPGGALGPAGLALFLAAAALPSPAAGTGTAVASSTAVAGGASGATALCPAGEEALGGGVDVHNVLTMTLTGSGPVFGPDPEDRLISQPDGNGPAPVGWRGHAANGGMDEGTVKVGAVCRDEASLSSFIGSNSAAASGGFGALSVGCGTGAIALGGGLALSNTADMLVVRSAPVFGAALDSLLSMEDGSQPAPTGWTATARNDTGVEQLVKAAVICSDSLSATTIVGSGTASAGSFGVERVLCPSGMEAVGGGVAPEAITQMEVTSSAPAYGPEQTGDRLLDRDDGSDRPAPLGWQASVLNEDGTPHSFKVAAICVPEPARGALAGSALAALGALRILGARRRAS